MEMITIPTSPHFCGTGKTEAASGFVLTGFSERGRITIQSPLSQPLDVQWRCGGTAPSIGKMRDDEDQFHITPIHDRMTTFVEPRDYEEYLTPAERPPVHLLRTLPASKMKVRLVETTPITNQQVSLFDSQ